MNLDDAIKQTLDESLLRLVRQSVEAMLGEYGIAGGRTNDYLVKLFEAEVDKLLREDPEVRAKLKAAVMKWIDEGCPRARQGMYG